MPDNEELLIFIRPPEFDNDFDWAQASYDDKLWAEEALRDREWLLEEMEKLIQNWRATQAHEAQNENDPH